MGRLSFLSRLIAGTVAALAVVAPASAETCDQLAQMIQDTNIENTRDALLYRYAALNCPDLGIRPSEPREAVAQAAKYYNDEGVKLARAGRYDEAIHHFNAYILYLNRLSAEHLPAGDVARRNIQFAIQDRERASIPQQALKPQISNLGRY